MTSPELSSLELTSPPKKRCRTFAFFSVPTGSSMGKYIKKYLFYGNSQLIDRLLI